LVGEWKVVVRVCWVVLEYLGFVMVVGSIGVSWMGRVQKYIGNTCFWCRVTFRVSTSFNVICGCILPGGMAMVMMVMMERVWSCCCILCCSWLRIVR